MFFDIKTMGKECFEAGIREVLESPDIMKVSDVMFTYVCHCLVPLVLFTSCFYTIFFIQIQFFVLIRLIIYVHTVFSSCEGRFFCLLFKKNPLPFFPRESEKTVAENQACQFCLPKLCMNPVFATSAVDCH